MEMGATAGEDYWPNAESEHFVKDLCVAFARNVDPEEHISVYLLFDMYDTPDFFDFEVRRICEGEKRVLAKGTRRARPGPKERLDIVRAVYNSPKHIVEIDFGYRCGLGGVIHIQEEWYELMLGLKDRSTLRSLILRHHNGFSPLKPLSYDPTMEAIASMLAHHPSIIHFTLSGWRIFPNEGVVSLAKALSANEKLETFTLDHCYVESSESLDILLQPLIPNEFGIQSELQGLSLLDCLLSQWIRENSIGKIIGNMLQKNTTLSKFCIDVDMYYSKSYQFIIKILKALKGNQHLKCVKFLGDGFDGKKILAEVVDLLHNKPSLKVDLHDTGLYKGQSRGLIQDLVRRNEQYLAMLSRLDGVAHDAHKGKAPRSSDGYMEWKVFKSNLEDSFLDKKNVRKGMKEVEVDDVIELMKRMNLCYLSDSNVAKFSQEGIFMPLQKLFIPATLRDENGDVEQGRRQLTWKSLASSSSNRLIYVGRRLQCEDVDRTFLPLGFFPRLQVVFRRTLGYPDNFSLEKNLIWFTYNCMEVFVEYSGHVAPMHLNDLVDDYIDILVKSSRDLEMTLLFVEKKMVNQIQELCSSPIFGCQGVILVESILNPECVEKLWLCVDRKNHAIEVEKLVQDVLIANDLEYMHEWPLKGPKGKEMRNCTTSKLLLGQRKWEVAIADKLYMGLKEIESSLVVECDPIEVQGFIDEHVDSIPKLAKFVRHELKWHTKAMLDCIDLAENRLATKMDAIIALQQSLMPEISRNIDKVISFSEQLQQRQVPRIAYITTKDVSTGQWLISSLVPGLSSVQLHFLCEHEGGIHHVESQKGDVLVLEGETLQSIRPYVLWGLRILSILMKVGAQGIIGGGSMVPNLEKMLLKGVAEMIPKVPTTLGEGGVQMEKVNLDKKFTNYEQESAEQWLVNFLRGKDIGVLFGLYRIKYKTSAKISWVCQKHKEEGLENNTMILLPTS